jgi:hypothetical protein
MAQAGERRIDRADHKLDPAPFESEHFRIAKRLRDYRVTGIQVAESHSLRLPIADCRLPIGFGFHVAIETAQ